MTPKTDSVAVLREKLQRYIKDTPRFREIELTHEEAAEIVAALSAQGEAYCYVGIGPMRGGPRDGTDDVRWYYESPAAAEYHGCHTIFPLYTAPGGVGDAVTEAQLNRPSGPESLLNHAPDALAGEVERLRMALQAIHHRAQCGSFSMGADVSRIAFDALAARTGKGEANV